LENTGRVYNKISKFNPRHPKTPQKATTVSRILEKGRKRIILLAICGTVLDVSYREKGRGKRKKRDY